jgi:hypothetical protein
VRRTVDVLAVDHLASAGTPANRLLVYLGVLLGILALAGGLIYRSRLTRVTGSSEPVLTDDMLRQIEQSGWIELDEPLDLDDIQEEEARFWEESWEEPEEW